MRALEYADGLYFGHVESQTLASGYCRVRALLGDEVHALVAVVDSNHKLAGAPRARLISSGILAVAVGDAVLLTQESFDELITRPDYFAGFDEVWFFDRVPKVPLPEGLVITGDVEDLRLPRYASWLLRERPLLGLGDGAGMNFVTDRVALARVLSESGDDKSQRH